MGTPINDPDGVGLVNGTFDNPDHWTIVKLWEISEGTADIIWPGTFADITMYQEIELQTDFTYTVEFDILTADCPGASGLKVRLGLPPSPESPLYTTIGHKSVDLSSVVANTNIYFYIVGSTDWPGEIEIDNVEIKAISSELALEYNLMPTQNTKSQIYNVDAQTWNVVLANYRDKSNILIAAEK